MMALYRRPEFMAAAAALTVAVAIVQGWGIVWVVAVAVWLALAGLALIRKSPR